MKILYLHQYFRFPYESGGTRSYDISKGLLSYGHEVEVISATSDVQYKNGKRWNSIERENIKVHYIYLPYNNHLSYFKRSLVFFKFLWFATFKSFDIKVDKVIATSTPLTIGVPAFLKKVFQKTPYVFEVRDVWPEAIVAIGAIKSSLLIKLLYFLEELLYKNASNIVTLSEDMKDSVVRRYPEQSKKVTVIENISEIRRFQKEIDITESVFKEYIGYKPRFTILYAGTFGKVNGLDYLVSLAECTISLDPSIIFVLVGKGAQKQEIINTASKKRLLNKNIFILDSVSKDSLPQLYFEASMGSSFVTNIKELWANSANKFFDTLAASRPILINYQGWQKKVIEKNNIGYVLPIKINPQEINKFVEFTRDENLVNQQRLNALNIAKQFYSLDIIVKKYNEVLNKN